MKNYVCAVAFEPDLQKAFLYSGTDIFPHSSTAELLLLYNYTKALSEFQDSAVMMESHCQLYVCCAAWKFMQNGHAHRYFRPKRMLTSASTKRPCASHMFITCNLRRSVSRAKPVAVKHVAMR